VFLGLNIKLRERWALRILEQESRAITAVQTLRNSEIVATIMSTGAIAAGSAILNLAANTKDSFQRDKMYAFSGCLFASFCALLLQIRALNHASFMTTLGSTPEVKINEELQLNLQLVPPIDLSEEKGELLDDQQIAEAKIREFRKRKALGFVKMVVRAEVFFSIGFRLIFMAISLAFWIFGSIWFLISAVGIVILLIINDNV
jgi:hypothetical protein